MVLETKVQEDMFPFNNMFFQEKSWMVQVSLMHDKNTSKQGVSSGLFSMQVGEFTNFMNPHSPLLDTVL